MHMRVRKETEVMYEYTGRDHLVPSNVTHVRIHSSVTKIGKGAFKDCKQLREVVLNDGLRVIGKSAFQECYSLEVDQYWG